MQQTKVSRQNYWQGKGYFDIYSKTRIKGPLKNKQKVILMTNGSLMKVQSIAECSPLDHSAVVLTCIKR